MKYFLYYQVGIKNKLLYLVIPIVFIYIRYIQYKYKKITLGGYGRTNSNLARLVLLQAKEQYYYQQFDAWGKYHPRFDFSNKMYKDHKELLSWLFPLKNYEQIDIVVWHKYIAATYYHNKIFSLTNGISFNYSKEILKFEKSCRS